MSKRSRAVSEKDASKYGSLWGLPEETYHANFDGLCEPENPGGVATYGVIIRKGLSQYSRSLASLTQNLGREEASNNVAEYSAPIRALEWLKEMDWKARRTLFGEILV